MLIALAAVGLISSLAVQKRMQEFTAVNAPKIKLANSMLSNASAMGIQSRSVVIRDAGFFKLARDQRVNF